MRYGRADAGSKSLSATMGTKMSLLNRLGGVKFRCGYDSTPPKGPLFAISGP